MSTRRSSRRLVHTDVQRTVDQGTGSTLADAPAAKRVRRETAASSGPDTGPDVPPASSGPAMPANGFEADRNARIAANAARLAALQLPALAAQVAPATAVRQASKAKGQPKQPKQRREPTRQSARTRGQSAPAALAAGVQDEDARGRVRLAAGAWAAAVGHVQEPVCEAPPSGPLQFVGASGEPGSDALFLAALQQAAAATASSGSGRGGDQPCAGGSQLSGLALAAADVAKLTAKAAVQMAWAPCDSKLLLATADKAGQVGLWDVDFAAADASQLDDAYDGTLHATPHANYVSFMKWVAGGGGLLSASYDGSVRRLDVGAGMWELVGGPQAEWSAGDASPDGHTVWLASNEGDLAMLDLRQGNANSPVLDIANRKVNTLSLHADGVHLAAADSAGTINLWDARSLSGKARPRPVLQLQHTKSCQAAYWAPCGEPRLLSISFDDTLRVWQPSSGASSMAKLSQALSIKHNNATGRWLVPFRPQWAPAGDAVAVGDMRRGVALFDASSGRSLGLLQSPELMTAIPSRLAMHPCGHPVVAAATNSGRAHIWR